MKRLLIYIAKPLYIMFFRCNWRRKNNDNDTHAVNRFHADHVTVGKSTYGPIEVLYDSGAGRLKIGNYCSIAKNVRFLLGGGHNYRRISTYPFQTKIYHSKGAPLRDERIDIVVEDDVWIGFDCIVLAGAKIGKGSVIGAGSVVTGRIPPYSVYVGNKVIKKRFSEEIIKEVENIDFSKIHHSSMDTYAMYCDKEISMDNIKIIKDSFETFSL